MANPERRGATAGHAQSARRPVDFELVLKVGRGEVARRQGPARRRSQRVLEGVGAGGLRVKGLGRLLWLSGWALAANAVGIVAHGAVVGGFLVAVLLQAGDEALDDVEFEEGDEVGDARGGDKDGLEAGGEVGAVLGACVWVQGDAEGEGGLGDVVAGGELEAVDGVCANGEAADFGLGAEPVGLEDEVHRRLGVGVEEGVGGDGGVPLGG